MNNQLNQLSSSVSNLLQALSELRTSDSITPYEYWRTLKEINEAVTVLTDEAQAGAFSQLSTTPKDVLDKMGVTLRKGYAQWDFSNVTYEPYLKASSALELAKKQLKAVEDQLKTMAKQREKVMPSGAEAFSNEVKGSSIGIVDTQTGDFVEMTLPTVKGYTRDSISFKKA